jgi:hypothetical protein
VATVPVAAVAPCDPLATCAPTPTTQPAPPAVAAPPADPGVLCPADEPPAVHSSATGGRTARPAAQAMPPAAAEPQPVIVSPPLAPVEPVVPLAPAAPAPVAPSVPPSPTTAGGCGTSVSGGGSHEAGSPLAILDCGAAALVAPGSTGAGSDLTPRVAGIAENPGSRPT